MTKYKGTFSANGTHGEYEFTSKSKAVKDMREIAKGNLSRTNCSTSSFCVYAIGEERPIAEGQYSYYDGRVHYMRAL
jgi:hypothetical protein